LALFERAALAPRARSSFLYLKLETIMTNRNPQDQKHVQGEKQKDEERRQKQQQAENPDRNQQGGFDPDNDRQQGNPDPVRHMPDQSR
jgi:hypothetical protein